MAKNVKEIYPEDFAIAVSEVIENYFDNVADAMQVAVASEAVWATQELRDKSARRTGEYANDWAIKYTKKLKRNTEIVIHNVKNYRLTHLLENPHRIVVHGTPTGKSTTGDGIIKTVNDKVVAKIGDQAWEIIKKVK